MEIVYELAALRGLRGMPKQDARRMRDALQQVADNHPQRMSYVVEMVDMPQVWRARKGDCRAVYSIIGDQMVVASVGNRKEIYR